MSAATLRRRLGRLWTRLAGAPGGNRGPEVPARCVEWRQADIFDIASLTIVNDRGRPVEHRCPLGVAVVSQSCDASQPSRPLIQLAPVTRLGATAAEEARGGKRPRYAHLPAAGDDLFADLDVIATAHKARLASATRTPGVSDDRTVRRFSGAVARRFGRYAFPDPVVACLQPLIEALRSRAPRPNSPLGGALSMVSSLRIEAVRGWGIPPYDLTLIVVLEPGALAVGGKDDQELPTKPPGLEEQFRDSKGKLDPNLIADRLRARDDGPDLVYWLWQLLGAAWAEQCESQADHHNLRDTVRSVQHELVSVDEFPLSRVNASEALDLDYISEPLPRPPGHAH